MGIDPSMIDQQMMQDAISDDMEGASDEADDMYQNKISKTPSQDIFYKGEQYKKGQRVEKVKNAHSQSMNQGNDSQPALPPSFDKNILSQHRNSADSEFNNKGHRKLRPASKGKILTGDNS
jgi:hypothetical protein